MTYNMQGTCWNCGHRLQERDYARESACPGCGRPTHVCRNCRFHDRTRANACAEPVADPISDKERPNFCGYFEAGAKNTPVDSPDEALRQAADDLFDL